MNVYHIFDLLSTGLKVAIFLGQNPGYFEKMGNCPGFAWEIKAS